MSKKKEKNTRGTHLNDKKQQEKFIDHIIMIPMSCEQQWG